MRFFFQYIFKNAITQDYGGNHAKSFFLLIGAALLTLAFLSGTSFAAEGDGQDESQSKYVNVPLEIQSRTDCGDPLYAEAHYRLKYTLSGWTNWEELQGSASDWEFEVSIPNINMNPAPLDHVEQWRSFVSPLNPAYDGEDTHTTSITNTTHTHYFWIEMSH